VGRLRAIEHSTFWVISRPVRRLLVRAPALRRAARGGLKLAWWTATFQLPTKLRERRETIAALQAEASRQAAASAAPPPPAPGPPFTPVDGTLRIAFASGEAHTPGHKYRVERWAEAARHIGAGVRIFSVSDAHANLQAVRDADMLFIWRAAWDDNIAALVHTAHAAGAPVLFDVDDLMFEPELARVEIIDGIRSQEFDEEAVADFYRRVQQTLLAADYVSAPTPLLAERMRRLWKTAFVLPNGFDDEVLERSRTAARRRRHERDGRVRIGYATGSKTHQKDFAQCVGAVARVLREHPETLLVLFKSGDKLVMDIREFPELAGLESRIEWRDLVPIERLPEELARFDVNLAPLEAGNPFCEAKSELKFFEAALVDVPTIASPTEPFQRAIRHGENGFLAADEAGWYDALKQLVQQPELRRETARTALQDSLIDFGPERRAELFHTVVEQIVPGPRRAAAAFELSVRRAAATSRRRPRVPAHEVVYENDRLRPSKATVVVPLYNYAGFVVEALESVRAQTLADIDLIVVDDASTDDSLAVALEWMQANAGRFNRTLLLKNTPNAGLGLTRNVGFENAETAFVAPLDADNRFRPDYLEKAVAEARRTGAAFVYPGIRQFGDAVERMGDWPYGAARLVGGNYIDAMALIRKSAWAAVGGYDHVRFGWEDYDLWCRFAEHGFFGQGLSEVLADYRVHGGSMLRSETNLARNNALLIHDIERRHPWLRISRPDGYAEAMAALAREATPGPAAAPSEEPAVAVDHASRLEKMLPILRDPETGRKLEWVDGELRTVGSGRPWPMVKGRPLLFPSLGEPKVMAPEHVSNGLPSEAIALIEAVDGLVLNLSAGGSGRRYDHVVEAEVAVFRHTDVIADAHALPFADETFELVVCFNAFEHYHTPSKAASEILRVLKPGGRVLMSTAFLQPLHEAPWHFYNATRYGLEKWFEAFEKLDLRVTENFNPLLALSWQMSEAEAALRDLSARDAERLLAATGGDLVDIWRDREARTGPLWTSFNDLSQARQEPISAGFQFLGRKPG